MKKLLKIAAILLMFSSCGGSADNKAPELADEMCGCFNSFQAALSPELNKLMKEVSTAQNPQDVLMEGVRKLDPEEAKSFGEKLKSMGDKDSDIFKCIENFDKKNSTLTTTDKKALTEKLLAEMQKKGGCFVGAAIINLNPKK